MLIRILIISVLCTLVVTAQNMPIPTNITFKNVKKELADQWISELAQDENGFMWVATQDGLYKHNAKRLTTYRYNPENTNTIPANWVKSMFIDHLNSIWIGTYGGGLSNFKEHTNTNLRISGIFNDKKFTPLIILKVFVSHDQTIFINTDLGVYSKTKNSNAFIKHQVGSGEVFFFEREHKTTYLGTQKGLYKYNTLNQKFDLVNKHVHVEAIALTDNNNLIYKFNQQLFYYDFINAPVKIEIPKNDLVYKISNVRHGKCIILGQKQTYILSLDTKAIHPVSGDFDALKKLGINVVFIDKQDLLWIGTTKGLFKQNLLATIFETTVALHARRILVDDSHIYIGGTNGLYKVNKDSDNIPVLLLSDRITSISKINADIVVGTFSGKLLRINGTNEIKRVSFNTQNPVSKIYGIIQDKLSRIWISTWEGIVVLSSDFKILKQFSIVNANKPIKILKLLYDQHDNIWANTVGNGLYKISGVSQISFESDQLNFQHYTNTGVNENSLNSDVVTDIHLDREGALWIGSDFGINSYDYKSNSFSTIRINNQIFDKKIMALETDKNGLLWIATIGDGIYAYNKKNNQILNYKAADGLASNACLFTSSAVDNDKLFFGTDAGVQIINTANYSYPKVTVKPDLTKLNVLGKDKQSFNLRFKKAVVLNHKQNSFEIDLGLNDYRFSEKIQYFYSFGQKKTNWIKASGENIIFNQVSSGTHDLSVKASYDPNDEAPISNLQIVILDPWYKTGLAYVLYSLLLSLVLYGLFQLRYKKTEALNKLKTAKELDQFKTNLFTNISHELRTPLTLIKGPVEHQLSLHKVSSSEKQELKLIKKNTDHLINLVNQILDLALIDSGQLKLQLKSGDLVFLMSQLISGFKYVADEKNITIKSQIQTQPTTYFDADCLTKIVSNLVTNAIKYSPKKSEININSTFCDNMFVLTVRNSVNETNKDDFNNYFERFYQSKTTNKGLGVGLNLVKELVDLHKGKIKVSLVSTDCIEFKVAIPMQVSYENQPAVVEELDDFEAANTKKQLILIVDDEEDMRTFLHLILKDNYQVIQAKNGNEGLNLATHHVPDIIVSDVSMPLLNGIDLSKLLKESEITSHIPIILLTAKNSEQDELEGLETGADDYIIKPFNHNKLLLRIKKLIQNRQKLQEFYTKGTIRNSNIAIPSSETEFLNKLTSVLNEHLTNSDFTAEHFSKLMLMSRTQLHRKLKATMGVTTSELIRKERLKLALSLLKASDSTVAEIAYQVGFNSPSYFIKCFKEVYKVTPNEYFNT